VNVPLLDPAATVTDAGTERFAEPELRLTVAPPKPAVPLRLTRQLVEAPGANELAVHPRLMGASTLRVPTAPSVPAIGIALPSADAPMASGNPTVTPALPDRVTATWATTPLAITSEFRPLAMQIYAVAVPAQLMVLLGPDSAGPAVTLKAETFACG
jgi:hypothetical protein